MRPAWALLLCSWIALEARAEGLEDARRLVNVELKFKQAIELLERLLSEPRLSVEDRVEAYRLMGVAYVARGAQDSAEAAFAALLVLEPDFVLDPRLSPKIQEAFARARARVATPVRLYEVVALPEERGVSFSARADDRGGRVASVALYTREDGGDYRASPMERAGERWIARLRPAGRRLEYYVVAADAAGLVLAQAASADSPSSLVRAPAAVAPVASVVEVEEPWYTEWWVWAIALGVVGAGTAAAVVLARSPEPVGGTLDPIPLD